MTVQILAKPLESKSENLIQRVRVESAFLEFKVRVGVHQGSVL